MSAALYYQIKVDDNFHYMDESERSDYGAYSTAQEALTAAKAVVDASLRHLYKPGFTPEQLYGNYTNFGEDPFIITDDPDCKFSAWTYAQERCPAICAEMAAKGPG